MPSERRLNETMSGWRKQPVEPGAIEVGLEFLSHSVESPVDALSVIARAALDAKSGKKCRTERFAVEQPVEIGAGDLPVR